MTPVVKARALRDEDKLERRNDILDAAERLFRQRPDGIASMDELAEAAKVAKGTLYLYFPSKELVLQALSLRHTQRMFDELDEKLASKKRFTLDDFYAIGEKHLLNDPMTLPLGTLVMGFIGRSLGVDDVIRFQLALGERLHRTGAALEKAFDLSAGQGVLFLNYTYALVIGVWQLGGCGRLVPENLKAADPKLSAFIDGGEVNFREALDHLWRGMFENVKRDGGKSSRGASKPRKRS